MFLEVIFSILITLFGIGNFKWTEAGVEARNHRQAKRSQGFLLLRLLTASVAFCWAPNVTYYMLLPFLDIANPTVTSVMNLMFGIQAIMDPILLTFSLKDIRGSFKNPFR